jgi:hypothetical protein
VAPSRGCYEDDAWPASKLMRAAARRNSVVGQFLFVGGSKI